MALLEKFEEAYKSVFIDNIIAIKPKFCDRIIGYLESPHKIEIPIYRVEHHDIEVDFSIIFQCDIEREPFTFHDGKFLVKVKPNNKKILVSIYYRKHRLHVTDEIDEQTAKDLLFDIENKNHVNKKISSKFYIETVLDDETVEFSEKGKLRTLNYRYYLSVKNDEIPLLRFCKKEFTQW